MKRATPQSTCVLAVGGGKGGTGKSLLVVQLGVLFAQQGLKTVMVDASPHGANLHSFLGLEDPEHTLDEVLAKECGVQEAVLPTGVPNLLLLPGMRVGLGLHEDPNLAAVAKQFMNIQADIVLWDVGSGVSDWSTYLMANADVGVMVGVPDAPSMECDYRFLRKVCRWFVADQVPSSDVPPMDWLPASWLARLQKKDSNLAQTLKEKLLNWRMLLLFNQVRSAEDKDLGNEVAAVCHRLLGITCQPMGWLEYDERMWLAIRQRQPMVLAFPESRWTIQLHGIFKELLPGVLSHR